jgi:hypothetical protein
MKMGTRRMAQRSCMARLFDSFFSILLVTGFFSAWLYLRRSDRVGMDSV